MSPKPTATKDSWKILPCPEKRAALDFSEAYDSSEYEQIKVGVIPVAMEDKWFMFFEDPWLFIYRSWTGCCIYGVRFNRSPTGAVAVEAWVSRDKTQYGETRIDYDRRVLKFLIDALLLDRQADFPVPGKVSKLGLSGVYQHAVVGRAHPENVDDPAHQPQRTLWERIRKRFEA